MRGELRGLLQAIDEIYASSTNPELWSPVVATLGAVFDSKATLGVVDSKSRWGSIPYSFGIDPSWAHLYQTYYYQKNVLVERLLRRGQVGQATIGFELVSEQELLRSEIYNEWLAPQGLFHVAGGIVSGLGEDALVLGLHRRRTASSFAEGDLEKLRTLMPHVRRAHELSSRLSGAAWEHAALDSLKFATFVVDNAGKIITGNRPAELLLAANDGLQVKNGRIQARLHADNTRLQGLIRSACYLAEKGMEAGGATIIHRPAPAAPHHLLIYRLQRDHVGVAALIVVADRERNDEVVIESLKAFGLSAMEEKVGSCIVQGDRATQIASSFGISIATVRTHIRHILCKTGTRDQLELVRLFMPLLRRREDAKRRVSK